MNYLNFIFYPVSKEQILSLLLQTGPARRVWMHKHSLTLLLVHESSGESHTYLKYSHLENPMDRGARETRVHRVAKSWT